MIFGAVLFIDSIISFVVNFLFRPMILIFTTNIQYLYNLYNKKLYKFKRINSFLKNENELHLITK